MKFRQSITLILLAASSLAASALEVVPYSAPALAAAQASGKPVALHFHADWCPTCRAQAKVFDALKSDPALDLTLLVADYDREKALKKELGVRVQSTVVVFKGAQETARLAGDTTESRLRGVLRSAL